MPPRLASGKMEKRCCVCGAPLGDWANSGCVDDLVTSVVGLRMVSMVLVL